MWHCAQNFEFVPKDGDGPHKVINAPLRTIKKAYDSRAQLLLSPIMIDDL
jgi:hypothetical protein